MTRRAGGTGVPGTASPADFIREELEARGWSQSDLAAASGLGLQTLGAIMAGRRITGIVAMCLGQAFGTSAELWTNLDAQWRARIMGGATAPR